MSLTPIQQSIINYIIAENEEIPQPDALTDYMRAIEGRSEPDMSFTLCYLENTDLTLYVLNDRSSPEQFNVHCSAIKNQLMEIADFICHLQRKGAVRAIQKEKNEFSLDMSEQWQPYTCFTPRERKVLGFISSVQIVPRLQLYNYWEHLQRPIIPVSISNPKVLV